MRNFWYDWGVPIMIVGLGLVVVFGILLGAVALGRADCYAQTADIGLPARWGFFSGCLVQLPDETWLPLDNYRYFSD